MRRNLAYRHGDTPLKGVLVTPGDPGDPGGALPGVLLIHEFTGLGEYMFAHADALARAGYAVLCADMYGAGIRPETREEALGLARIQRADRALMRERAAAGLAALSSCEMVDSGRLFAAGFSFGGCAALELARASAPLLAAASFYGYLNTPLPAAPGAVRASLLVLHGARDKIVPASEIPPFKDEMERAGASCRLVVYSEAGHAFSNPEAPDNPAEGSSYHPETARKAWLEMLSFFAEAGGVPL